MYKPHHTAIHRIRKEKRLRRRREAILANAKELHAWMQSPDKSVRSPAVKKLFLQHGNVIAIAEFLANELEQMMIKEFGKKFL